MALLFRGGEPTFQKVMAGIKLLEQHHVSYNILTVVNSGTAMKYGVFSEPGGLWDISL